MSKLNDLADVIGHRVGGVPLHKPVHPDVISGIERDIAKAVLDPEIVGEVLIARGISDHRAYLTALEEADGWRGIGLALAELYAMSELYAIARRPRTGNPNEITADRIGAG